MAEKEVVVFVVDAGYGMNLRENDHEVTNSEFILTYIKSYYLNMLWKGSKDDAFGCIAFNTEESDYSLPVDSHIRTVSKIQTICGTDLLDETADFLAKPSNNRDSNVLLAIAMAVDQVRQYCNKAKYLCTIIVICSGYCECSSDALESAQLTYEYLINGFTLRILGINFNDPDFGYVETKKDPQKMYVESALRSFSAITGGTLVASLEIMEQLDKPCIKKIKPVRLTQCNLSIGDPNDSKNSISIQIERFPKTRLSKAMRKTLYHLLDEEDANEDARKQELVIEPINRKVAYQLADDNADDGVPDTETEKKEKIIVSVDPKDSGKGYRFGQSILPVTEALQNLLEVDKETPSLQIIASVPVDTYPRFYHLSETNIIIGNRKSLKDQERLSYIIDALFDESLYLLARSVSRGAKGPMIVLLAPYQEFNADDTKFQCLMEVELPFRDDVLLKSGNELVLSENQKRDLKPSEELVSAMQSYIEKMDLGSLVVSENTYNIKLHKYKHAIIHRAISNAPIPDFQGRVFEFSHPCTDGAETEMNHVKSLLDLKPNDFVEVKRKREEERPVNLELDVESLLKSEKQPVTKKTAQASQETKLANTYDLESVISSFDNDLKDPYQLDNALDTMKNTILTLIELKKTPMDLFLRCLYRLRRASVEEEESGQYNKFIELLKEKMMATESKRLMWEEILDNNLGTLTQKETVVNI